MLCDQGDFAGARALHERALAVHEKAFGPEHPATAKVCNLASYSRPRATLRGHGRSTSAHWHHEKALGPEHPRTANSLSSLAFVLANLGDYAAARPLYERALAIYEKALGPEHQDTNLTRFNLSRLLLMSGQLTEALCTWQDRPRRSRQGSWTGPRLDQGRRPRHCRRARRAWPRRGGEGAAGAVWGHAP